MLTYTTMKIDPLINQFGKMDVITTEDPLLLVLTFTPKIFEITGIFRRNHKISEKYPSVIRIQIPRALIICLFKYLIIVIFIPHKLFLPNLPTG